MWLFYVIGIAILFAMMSASHDFIYECKAKGKKVPFYAKAFTYLPLAVIIGAVLVGVCYVLGGIWYFFGGFLAVDNEIFGEPDWTDRIIGGFFGVVGILLVIELIIMMFSKK